MMNNLLESKHFIGNVTDFESDIGFYKLSWRRTHHNASGDSDGWFNGLVYT